jgi:hypothetical protein
MVVGFTTTWLEIKISLHNKSSPDITTLKTLVDFRAIQSTNIQL